MRRTGKPLQFNPHRVPAGVVKHMQLRVGRYKHMVNHSEYPALPFAEARLAYRILMPLLGGGVLGAGTGIVIRSLGSGDLHYGALEGAVPGAVTAFISCYLAWALCRVLGKCGVHEHIVPLISCILSLITALVCGVVTARGFYSAVSRPEGSEVAGTAMVAGVVLGQLIHTNRELKRIDDEQ